MSEFPFIYYNSKVVNPLSGVKPLIKVNFNCEDEHPLLNKGNGAIQNMTKHFQNDDFIKNFILIGAKNKEDILYW